MRVAASMGPGRLRFEAGAPAQRVLLDSDKCDWRVSADEFEVSGESPAARRVQARLTSPGGRIESDKCDFAIRADAAEAVRPDIRTEVSSDKCDFSIAMDVGWEDRRVFKLRGAGGSSKCDFTFRPEVWDERTDDWRPLDSFSQDAD